MTENTSPLSEPLDLDETEVYPTDEATGDGRIGDANVGERVGPYRILRKIADGGMGAVYLAEREDHFKQRVALKMIHTDKTTDTVLKRFYAERQILADLEHPHIARIFDGGATHGTLPFFVMEYVEGEPFDRACSELSLQDRLRLFQKVCAAVHHAHRSLIVHRDLKPNNILVTAEGEPKLLDFGIAKHLQPENQQQDKPSGRSGLGPMTIAFASPEQLNGDAITISTDVYSLGVLLYTILSGRHPYQDTNTSTAELINAILFLTPAPPSDVADHDTSRRLVGDLDAIVLKALSKKPEERYDSTAQLAEEIQLHLDDLPIRAWRGTWLGRLRKSARRNKLALAATLLLFAFSITASVLWRHAVTQQVAAERAQIRAERIKDFILEFFKSMEPDRSPGPEVDLKKVLDSGRYKLEESLRNEPEVRADLLGTVATVYHALAFYDDSLSLQEEALQHRRSTVPRNTRALAVDLTNLGNSYYSRKEYDKAEQVLDESLSLWRQLDDPFEINAMVNLAIILSSQDRKSEALIVYSDALARSIELGLEEEPNAASIYYGLGATYKHLNQFAEAEPHLRRALNVYSLNSETRPSRRAQVISSLGEVLQARGQHSEARLLLEQALEIRLELFGIRHPKTAASQRKLALLLAESGERQAAEELLRQAISSYSSVPDEEGGDDLNEAQEVLEQILFQLTNGDRVEEPDSSPSSGPLRTES